MTIENALLVLNRNAAALPESSLTAEAIRTITTELSARQSMPDISKMSLLETLKYTTDMLMRISSVTKIGVFTLIDVISRDITDRVQKRRT